MYSSVSNNFKTECKRDVNAYKRIAKIHVVEDNIDITNDNDLVSFTIDETAYSGQTFVGNSVARAINFSIINDGTYNLEDKEIAVYVGIDYVGDGSNVELIPYGNFIVSKPENEEVKNKSSYTAYDYMIKAETPYTETNIVYPISLYNYLSAICTTIGITLGNQSIPNGSYQVLGNAYTNGESFRQVIEEIARCCGGFAVIGRDNKLYIKTLTLINNNENETITTGEYYEDFGRNNAYGPVNRVAIALNYNVYGEDTIREDTESIAQNGLTAIRVSDISFLNSEAQRELVIGDFWSNLHGLTYVPFSTDYYGYPYLDLGDIVKITLPDNTDIYSYVLTHSFTYNGGFSGKIEAPALSDVEDEYSHTPTAKSAIRNTELKVDKINGEISSIIEEIGDRSQKQTSITQDIDTINLTISDLENLTLEEQGLNPLTLENCLDGEVININIKGNNTVFDFLAPNNALYPANDLYPFQENSNLKIYTNNKCPTKEDAWNKEPYNLAQDLTRDTEHNRYLATWYYPSAGMTKYRASLRPSGSTNSFYYVRCSPNTKYILKLPEELSIFYSAMSCFDENMFDDITGSTDDLFSPYIVSNARYDGEWKYDYQTRKYELTTGDDSYYLVVSYDYRVKNNFELVPENAPNIKTTTKSLVPIDKGQTTYFYLLGYDSYYLTDVLYYNENKELIGNYEDVYSETIKTRQFEMTYPNDAVYCRFVIQKIENNVPVVDADDFDIEKIKPMLANSTEYDFVNYNEQIIDLGIDEPLRQYSNEVYDEFVYDTEYLYNEDESDNGQAYKSYVIRRVGINQNSELYPLANPIIEPLNVDNINLVQGTNYVDLDGYTANMSVKYVQITDFTKIFATQYKVTSQILQLANQISLIVTEKVGEDEIIAKINLAVKDEQGIIEILGNQITIKSDYFELTPDGHITATAGRIGGWTLTENKLYSEIQDTNNNNQIIQAGMFATSSLYGPFFYAGYNPSGDEGTGIYGSNFYVTHNGTVHAKHFMGNVGEYGSFVLNFDNGNTAVEFNNYGLRFRIDNATNNNFFYLERLSSQMWARLYDATELMIHDSVHNLPIVEFRRQGDNSFPSTPETDIFFYCWYHKGQGSGSSGYQIATLSDISDKNVKKNIKKAEKSALKIIDEINFVQFDWDENEIDRKGHIDIGVIAQDLQQIDENYVDTTKIKNNDKAKDVYYINDLNLLTTTTKAVQELSEKVKEQQNMIDKQNKIIQDLIERIEKLEKGEK